MKTSPVEEIPYVPSPYETGRPISVGQHLSLAAYWFATNFLWGAMLLLLIPNQVKTMNPGYRAETVGILTGVAAVVAVVLPLIVGALSDRCASKWGRRRPYMVLGIVINVIGLIGMAVAYEVAKPSPVDIGLWNSIVTNGPLLAYFLSYLVVQCGNNVASAAYMGVIPDVVPADQRGTASGYMALMSQAGTLFGALGAGVLLDGQPEWIKYILMIFVLGGIGALTLFGFRENPLPWKPAPIQWRTYVKSLWIDPKAHPDFAWVWITRALVMLGFYAVMPQVNYYLVDVIRVPHSEVDRQAVYLLAIILVMSSMSGVYGGRVSDRIGRKKVVYISNSAIAAMVLGFIFCRTTTDVLIVGTLFGLGYGAYSSVDYALGTDVLPNKANAGKEMAVWHVAMTLPQSLASPAAGFLIAAFGKTELPPLTKGGEPIVHYTTQGYAAIFVLCAVCFALGAVFLKNVRGVR